MGRPSKLTPERQATLCGFLRQGLHMEQAATLSGIGLSTLYKWLEAGGREGAEQRHVDFRTAVARARADAEAEALDIIREGYTTGFEERRVVERVVPGNGPEGEDSVVIERTTTRRRSPQCAQWFLERGYPERWGQRQKLDVTAESNVTKRIIVEFPQGYTPPDPGARLRPPQNLLTTKETPTDGTSSSEGADPDPD